MEKSFTADRLTVRVLPDRGALGRAAAADIERAVLEVLARQAWCTVIFAAAPSQNETLAALAASDRIDWSRVRALHMDEYIGLPPDAPQGFASFLRRALFDRVPLGEVYCLDGTADPEAEAARYAALLRRYPPDMVVMGIGENGHIAFNDPHAARFHDPDLVKTVELDEVCRTQQVHDGCFPTFADVPRKALTLTIPALTAPEHVFCAVPGTPKAPAVLAAVRGPVSEACPASVLRTHPRAVLYLDPDSASLLEGTEEVHAE